MIVILVSRDIIICFITEIMLDLAFFNITVT
jgi:hypothetical protein